jgi:hypothetical protein
MQIPIRIGFDVFLFFDLHVQCLDRKYLVSLSAVLFSSSPSNQLLFHYITWTWTFYNTCNICTTFLLLFFLVVFIFTNPIFSIFIYLYVVLIKRVNVIGVNRHVWQCSGYVMTTKLIGGGGPRQLLLTRLWNPWPWIGVIKPLYKMWVHFVFCFF